ncbi:MAG: Frr, ribosome recycling factor [Parcubacteria group bacterium]|nr:Frr, ribosome recycling factor [Parcubacteria group bacterium]
MAYDFKALNAHIKETEEWLQREFTGIRTGRATPQILDNVKPEIYGALTPIQQVASVTIEDARTLRILPWDKSITKNIEKAIIDADLGVGVGSDDQGVRVSFPELTAERRGMLQKLAKDRLEQARITLRGHRTDAMKELEASEKEGGMGQDDLKRYKEELQKLIDKGNEGLEAIGKKKEVEIEN